MSWLDSFKQETCLHAEFFELKYRIIEGEGFKRGDAKFSIKNLFEMKILHHLKTGKI